MSGDLLLEIMKGRILFFLIAFPGVISCERQNQANLYSENPLVGSWKFIKVDSCRQPVVYPPSSQITRVTVNDSAGTISFNKDGTGIITSYKMILCNESAFEWKCRSDLLYFTNKKGVFSTQVNFIGNDTMWFDKKTCYPWRGVDIWFNVSLIRSKPTSKLINTYP